MGHSLIGAFHGHKSGHQLNNELLKKVLRDEDAWELVSFDNLSDAPIRFGGQVLYENSNCLVTAIYGLSLICSKRFYFNSLDIVIWCSFLSCSKYFWT